MLRGVLLARKLRNKRLSTNDVQSGDTEESLRVECVVCLENLGSDGDGRVHRVGDDEDASLGAKLGTSGSQVSDDTGVNLEEIISGHSRLPWARC
jgi:hypothetical protein